VSDCNKSFAEQFQGLKNRSDEKVRVTILDQTSAYLKDKLIGASGVYFYEDENGVSGHQYIAAVDLDYLDNRYLSQIEPHEILNFDIGAGVHNGFVRKDLLNGHSCLNYPDKKISQSQWSAMVSQDYVSGETNLFVRWASEQSSSGVGVFNVQYKSYAEGDLITNYPDNIVSGYHDGYLRINELKLNIPIGTLNDENQVFVRITRLGNVPEDTLGDLKIFGVSIKFNRI
jgi:hypothetical protein